VIPDNQTGIERTLTTNTLGTVGEVAVSVSITHTYIGDLVVQLISPAGTEVVLHQRTGSSADNIETTYTSRTTPALSAFTGEPVSGSWRLRVSDHASADTGRLNRWKLMIRPTVRQANSKSS
jgi:subtilisin-like proprotein convertase family protein